MSDKLRILIVDDDQRMARTLKDILTVKGHEAVVAHSGHEALEKMAETHFDCLLSDIKMPGINGVELFRAVRKTRPDLPVVLMTAYAHDELIKDGLEEGILAVLAKPLDINALLGFFAALRKEKSIVIVDDDPVFCKTLGDILQARGFVVNEIVQPAGIVDKIQPDSLVVLLDMKLNGLSGLDVLKEIRERCPSLPVIMATGYREETTQSIEAALKIGAYTCIYKPFQIEELLQLLAEINRQKLARILGRTIKKK
ncbi:response regulator [bacterium]|nr:response regulator [bacterium]